VTAQPTSDADVARGAADAGFVTLQFVLAAALSLLLVAVVANLVVFQYGRGVVRAALDEGARAGARVDDGAHECRRRAEAVLGDLLGGAMGRGVSVTCADLGFAVVADARAQFPGWAPGVPAWAFTMRAQAARR
jgi:hypothetical protein